VQTAPPTPVTAGARVGVAEGARASSPVSLVAGPGASISCHIACKSCRGLVGQRRVQGKAQYARCLERYVREWPPAAPCLERYVREWPPAAPCVERYVREWPRAAPCFNERQSLRVSMGKTVKARGDAEERYDPGGWEQNWAHGKGIRC
jgi:hypothetical protein